MRLYPSITVDLYKPYPLVVLDVPQNNIGRGAMVTLTAGGAVVIPENETVEVYAKKPDGTKVYNTVIVAGNQLQVAFSPQMTAVEGILQAELQMIDSTGNSITTPIFAVRILKSNIDANAIVSQDDFQALVDALAEVEEIKSTIQKGDPGEAATIQIGTVTASDPGSNPQVNNSGTEQDAVFDFVFPRGDPGSMWYQGDAITGKSTSGTVFSGSGIANAEVNDMYLNTGSGADRGNVYVCTLAGNASTAQWAYKQNIMGPTGPAGTANASSVAYDNETSGLTADNVQGALDELTNNLNIIRLSLQTVNTPSYYLSNVNEYEEMAKIDNLPSGIYIASGRVQRNVHESVTDVTSWVSVDGGGSPNTSYGTATTIPGGTQYPIASIVRFITLSQSGSIRLYVRSNNKDAGFGGVLQILRIA